MNHMVAPLFASASKASPSTSSNTSPSISSSIGTPSKCSNTSPSISSRASPSISSRASPSTSSICSPSTSSNASPSKSSTCTTSLLTSSSDSAVCSAVFHSPLGTVEMVAFSSLFSTSDGSFSSILEVGSSASATLGSFPDGNSRPSNRAWSSSRNVELYTLQFVHALRTELTARLNLFIVILPIVPYPCLPRLSKTSGDMASMASR
mmetsp:Transcript_13635/g.27779  ORF Transcript_13635/g.27779 Transcript_13635/m.27779 type:complete len:207 (-) Transcript_13635:2169-2789(-)